MAALLWSLIVLSIFRSANSARPERLPRDCLPEHYDLQIQSSGYDLASFNGSVQIVLKCNVDTSRIVLHWKNQFVYENETTVKQIGSKTAAVKLARIGFDPDRDLMRLELGQSLKKGSRYVVTVAFSTEMVSAGLYRTAISNDSQENSRWIVMSRFYPNLAHTMFPCFDEPDLVSSFNLTLIYDQQFSGVSNLELQREYSIVNGVFNYTVQTYASTKQIAPFQLAFSLNDFTEIEESDELHYNVFGYTDGDFREVETALNYTASILQFFEDSLGLMWPTENLSLVPVPGLSLEYLGAAGLLGIPYVTDWKNSEELKRQLSTALMRHMLSARIELKSWSDVWFIEGFAWYYGYKASMLQLDESNLSSWYDDVCWSMLNKDEVNSTGPLINASLSIEEIGQKAFCIFQTVAQFIGPENFLLQSKSFMKNVTGGSLDIQVFLNSFKSTNVSSNPNMKELLTSWFNSSGVSVLNVTRSATITSLEVIQLCNTSTTSRWIPAASSSSDPVWTNSKRITTKVSLTVPLNPDKLLYYKILYDTATYESLLTNRMRAKLDTAVTRAQLINDVLDFAWYGYTSYSTALKMVSYLSNETNYLPWLSASNHFEKLWYILRGISKHDNLRSYLIPMITQVYSKIGTFTKFNGLSADEKKLQALIATWACRLALSNCITTANKLFRNIDQVPDHLLGVVLRESARSGNETEWYLIRGMYTKPTSINRLVHIVRAIGSFTPRLLPHALDLINGKSSFIPSSHRQLLLETLLEEAPNPLLLHGILLFEFHNIDQSFRRYVLRKMAQRMVLDDDLLVLQKLAGRYESQAVDVAPLRDAIEITQRNLSWLKGRSGEFLAALKQK